MDDCIFCKLASHQIPTNVIYEDENFFVFLDNFPLNYAHTLVIPKKHYRWVWDYPDVGEYYKVVKKIVEHYKKVFNIERVDSMVFGGGVSHAHVHVIPHTQGKWESILDFIGEKHDESPKLEISKEELDKLKLD